MRHEQQALAGADPRWRTLWLWHSAEESEHRCTAFDLYRATGGNEKFRRSIFRIVTLHFFTDLARQTLHHLRHDGALFKLSTWRSAWRLLFARGGLIRESAPGWRRYLQADFHPSQGDHRAARQWLHEHAAVAPAVSATGAA
jgi:predicted metal-dependent hydrolase